MDREEHLKKCKELALEYLSKGDVVNAITSMLSDLDKHPKTKLKSTRLSDLGMFIAQSGSISRAKSFIEGFR